MSRIYLIGRGARALARGAIAGEVVATAVLAGLVARLAGQVAGRDAGAPVLVDAETSDRVNAKYAPKRWELVEAGGTRPPRGDPASRRIGWMAGRRRGDRPDRRRRREGEDRVAHRGITGLGRGAWMRSRSVEDGELTTAIEAAVEGLLVKVSAERTAAYRALAERLPADARMRLARLHAVYTFERGAAMIAVRRIMEGLPAREGELESPATWIDEIAARLGPLDP